MKHLIFDFDGTLADTVDLTLSVFHELTGREIPITAIEFAAMRKLPAHRLAKALGIPLYRAPFLLNQGRKMMHERIDEITIFPEVAETVVELQKRGYELRIVSSNSKENIIKFLQKYNIEHAFTDVVGSIGIFRKSKALEKVMQQANIQKSEAIYIGDEARDVEAANNITLPIVAVSWGYNDIELLQTLHTHKIAQKPADLLEIFP